MQAEKSYEVWDANQARQFKSALDKHHKDMWKSWKKAADNKPHKVVMCLLCLSVLFVFVSSCVLYIRIVLSV